MRFEGGFQGRCNKLVDGCYSFWQAGLLPLLHRALFKEGEPYTFIRNKLFGAHLIDMYSNLSQLIILMCCSWAGLSDVDDMENAKFSSLSKKGWLYQPNVLITI